MFELNVVMFVAALNGKVSTTVLQRLENQWARGQFVINDLTGAQNVPFLPIPFFQHARGPVVRIGRMRSDLRRDPEGDDANAL